MELTINDSPMTPPGELTTWGDLLDWLETEHLKAGQCITRVTFAGNEEIQYRKPAALNRDIEAIGSIQIESGEFDAVIRESFEELEVELRSALESTRATIQLFEARNEEAAYLRLGQVLDATRIFYSLFSEDLGWQSLDEIERVRQTATLENAIRQLITAQENRFWVAICDVLEYELIPILESWLLVVEKTRVHVN
jgi:hypothetical protein